MPKVKTIIVFFTGLIFGVLTSTSLYNSTSNSFWQFSLFDLISFAIYILIGVYVAHHLKNRFSDRQIKKNLFVDIANDIENLLEKNLPCLTSFMKSNSDTEEERIKVLLILRKINNKIHVLEKYKLVSHNITKYVNIIRKDNDEIKEIITGDEFSSPRTFTQQQINKVYKFSCDLIFNLDEIKLNIFV